MNFNEVFDKLINQLQRRESEILNISGEYVMHKKLKPRLILYIMFVQSVFLQSFKFDKKCDTEDFYINQ